MNVRTMSAFAIRKKGIEALAKSLGPVGMARFFQQFENGDGNYTKERQKLLRDMDVKHITSEIKSKRRKRVS